MSEPMIADSEQLRVAVRFQFQSYLRTYRFLTLLIVIVAILSIIFLVLLLDPPSGFRATSSDVDYMAFATAFLGVFIYITVALLGGDAISGDFGARTGYYTLVLPMRRSVLFLGRYLAAILAAFVIVLVWFAYSVLQTLYFYHTIPGLATLQSLGISLLFAAAAMGLAFFFSSLVKSPTVSIILTFVVLFLLLPIAVEIVDGFTSLNPWWSLTSAAALITQPFASGVRGGVAAMTWVPTYAQGLGIMVGYLVAFLVVGYFLYEYKESTG